MTTMRCNIVTVGKRRDGGTRFWCLQHRADATAKYGKRAKSCRAAHLSPIDPKDRLEMDIDRYKGGIALWGAVPAVYDTTRLPMDRGIHVHARQVRAGKKEMDCTFREVRLSGGSLPEAGIVVSELDAIYFMVSSIFGYDTIYVTCSHCGYAHLDKDWFSVHPHRRHLCAGCGRHFPDQRVGVGNPISGIRDACRIKPQRPVNPKRQITIRQRDFPAGIQIWGTNPALIWTSQLQEEEGIHLHAFIHDGDHAEIDETYSTVTIDGVKLNPVMVRILMAQMALPSLKGRVISATCPSCGRSQFDTGNWAFTPQTARDCNSCGTQIAARGRLRRVVMNPLVQILLELGDKAPRSPQVHELDLLPESL